MDAVILQAVDHDGFDRDLFDRLLQTEPALRRVIEKGRRLLPHPEALLMDLFSAMYKLNVVLRRPTEVSASVMINRRLVAAVVESDHLVALRNRTQLDVEACREALPSLAERVIRALTKGDRVVASELISAAESAEDESALADRLSELEHLESLPEGSFSAAEEIKRSLKRDIDALKKKNAQNAKQQADIADALPLDLDNEIQGQVRDLPEQLSTLDTQAKNLGLDQGGAGRVGAERRMALGERLLASRKLQLLARLTGAFREVAFESRRKRIRRAPQALHAVRTGQDLARLLPSELVGIRKAPRGRHLEWLRRYAEGDLLQYDLRAPASRGPMVVCVDGSGSMQGSKELWAKAVALTLMEIARRERRRCLGLVFSAGHKLFEVELLKGGKGGGRLVVQNEAVFEFAEYFPRGGTSFEEPLRRAVEAVSEGRYRRGDIVFVTDGEAPVSDALVEWLKPLQKRHRFKVRGLLVDAGHHTGATLSTFCDDVRTVSDLTSDGLSDLFSAV
ncbi:MAG: VWA domain-containing protein [Myxococcota bacterium]